MTIYISIFDQGQIPPKSFHFQPPKLSRKKSPSKVKVSLHLIRLKRLKIPGEIFKDKDQVVDQHVVPVKY